MLIVTSALRKHAVANWGLKDSATDAEVRREALNRVSKKELTHSDLADIRLGKKAKKPGNSTGGGTDGDGTGTGTGGGSGSGTGTGTGGGNDRNPTDPPRTGEELFKTSNTQVRLKSVSEHFKTTKDVAVYPKTFLNSGKEHPRAGAPVMLGGSTFETMSELDKAIAGVVVKAALQTKLMPNEMRRWHRWTELDQQLWDYALREKEWVGVLRPDKDGDGGIPLFGRKLDEYQRKTLIADTTSGGLYAVPAAFDDAIIIVPLLYGEVFPHLNLQDVRSNRVQGATMSRPTYTSGVIEGTGVQPFDTSGFIGAFDTPVYNAQGGMEIGKDLEEDSPVAIGDTVVRMFGEAAMVWLDRVASYGNGVTEPQGMLRAAGLTLVNSSFGASGPMTVNDYQSLYFALTKAFRTEPGAYLSYLSNDSGYRNGRYIQIGTDDQRRVLGMDWEKYTIGDNPYAVQNDIPDGLIGFFNMKRYNMYRRLGTQITVDDSGYQLRTRNTRLITARMRFGGRLNQAGAGAYMSDAQSF
jgi:HK97 family phage major capsid protein